ncbi:hypothetical protein K491DRAFT_573696, partial [Lophiostoma macrostomum CBS 122681]
LSKLLPLPKDHHLTAFGPDGRNFFGSPNGSTGTNLPTELVDALIGRAARRVLFVSFGYHSDLWFVSFEGRDGKSDHSGTLPNAVFALIASNNSRDQKFLRLQYGPGNSCVAWTESKWACHDLPTTLHSFLKQISCPQQAFTSNGEFRGGHPTQITWHPDGSFFVIGCAIEGGEVETSPKYHVWEFASDAIDYGWRKLWQTPEDSEAYKEELSKLAHVSIDPYKPLCNQYVFILKSEAGKEPDFALQFDGQELVLRHSFVKDKIQRSYQAPRKFIWAYSKHTGRPHRTDTWELPMKKDQRVKVYKDQGNDWYLVENMQGKQGFAHSSWLDLKRIQVDVYQEFVHDVDAKFKLGTITVFPNMRLFVVDRCSKEECKHNKAAGDLNICAHELEHLLRGSGCYSHAFLKEERNKWHPDKFARHCHPAHRDDLKRKSQELFVMMGLLMDV